MQNVGENFFCDFRIAKARGFCLEVEVSAFEVEPLKWRP